MSTTTNQVVSTYHVTGMTCGHCAGSVRAEIGAVPGVCDVDVDLTSGEVTVRSDRQLTHEEIAAAVDEAGYQLAS